MALLACWWPCCGQSERIIVICHDRFATAAATGSVSRLDESDLSTLWTYDLGADSGTGRNKRAKCCKITSAGDIYVSWDLGDQVNVAGMFLDNHAGSGGGPAGGVVKLDKDGNLVASWDAPTRHGSYGLTTATLLWGHGIDVDENDPDAVWLGTIEDTNGDWLHLLDGDLSLVSSFGASEIGLTPGSARAANARVEVDHEGNCWSYTHGISSPSTRVRAIDSTGSVIYTPTTGALVDDFTLDMVSNILLYAVPQANASHANFQMRLWNNLGASAADWTARMQQYSYVDFMGQWDGGVTGRASVASTGSRALMHTRDNRFWQYPAPTYNRTRQCTTVNADLTLGTVSYVEVSSDNNDSSVINDSQQNSVGRFKHDPGLGNGSFLLYVGFTTQGAVAANSSYPVQQRTLPTQLSISGHVQGSNLDQTPGTQKKVHWGDVRTIA